MQTIKIISIVVAALVSLYLLDRLGLWAERRGWIYWRMKKPTGNSLGNAALELQQIFESGKSKHVIEAIPLSAAPVSSGR